jgi:hypothetical protein
LDGLGRPSVACPYFLEIPKIFKDYCHMQFSRETRRGVGAPRKTIAVTRVGPKRMQNSVENAVRSDKGEDIYHFRRAIGFGRRELGELLGVTWFPIYCWEHGKGQPSPLAWQAFCRVRANYRRKMKRLGKDLDGGPVMGDKS